MRLNVERFGEAQGGAPLLMAHGLLGQSRNFASLAKRLARSRPVLTVDMRNHGDSPRADSMDYRELAADLADTLGERRADVLGHSMGGKAAMALALARPDKLRRLIVVDIAPIAYDHDHAEMIEAMLAVDLSGIERRSQAEAALEPAVPETMMRAFLLQNLEMSEGTARWKPALQTLLDQMTQLLGFPSALAESRFDGPTLFLRGGASPYVPDSAHETIRTLFPQARIETLEGAAHWLHADKPEAFISAVEAFLAD